MSKYNYKCVVNNTGSKKYYKNVRGKWKRINNKIGMKAELKYLFDITKCNEDIEDDKLLKCSNSIRVINDGNDIMSEVRLHVQYQEINGSTWNKKETFAIDQLKLKNGMLDNLRETLNDLDVDDWNVVKQNGDFRILKNMVPITHVEMGTIKIIDFGLKLQKREDGMWKNVGRLISNKDWIKIEKTPKSKQEFIQYLTTKTRRKLAELETPDEFSKLLDEYSNSITENNVKFGDLLV